MKIRYHWRKPKAESLLSIEPMVACRSAKVAFCVSIATRKATLTFPRISYFPRDAERAECVAPLPPVMYIGCFWSYISANQSILAWEFDMHAKSRRLNLQLLEQRNLLAADLAQNFVEAEDVDLDGRVSLLDLTNLLGQVRRQQADLPATPADQVDTKILPDVNGNGFVNILDGLLVINRLRAGARDPASLEGGVDQLARAILTDELPVGMRPQIAERWLARLEERTSAEPSRRGAFNRFDGNDDGEIRADEVHEQAWAQLASADGNDDGTVTLDELREDRVAEDSVQRPGALRFNHLDSNEDGQLSRDEVSSRLWQRLAVADANDDGGVSLEELLAACEDNEGGVQRPQLIDRFFAELDINEDGQLTQDEVSDRTWPWLARVDANDDGGVTKDEIQTAWLESEDRLRQLDPGEWFGWLDQNSDGKLSANELGESIWNYVSIADANSDSGVSLAELTALYTAGRDAFARVDRNDDGQLSATELTPLVWAIISVADSNRDGGVTAEELIAAIPDLAKQYSGLPPSVWLALLR
jgi:Ca2+-binding EF-hand superfamily protein